MRFFRNQEAIECTKGIAIKLVYLQGPKVRLKERNLRKNTSFISIQNQIFYIHYAISRCSEKNANRIGKSGAILFDDGR